MTNRLSEDDVKRCQEHPLTGYEKQLADEVAHCRTTRAPVVPVEAVLGLVQAKADAIRSANTYKGRVNQNAEMSAIFVEDLKDPIRGLIPEGFLLAHAPQEQKPVVPSISLLTSLGYEAVHKSSDPYKPILEAQCEKIATTIHAHLLAHGWRDGADEGRQWKTGGEIGEAAKARFQELAHKGWDYQSFYNGFLEGATARPSGRRDRETVRDLSSVRSDVLADNGGPVQGDLSGLHCKDEVTPPPSNAVREAVEALIAVKELAELSTDVRDLMKLHELLGSIIYTSRKALAALAGKGER